MESAKLLRSETGAAQGGRRSTAVVGGAVLEGEVAAAVGRLTGGLLPLLFLVQLDVAQSVPGAAGSSSRRFRGCGRSRGVVAGFVRRQH